MGDITSRIRLFHSLYLGCLSGTVIFACISAVMYLYLDIRTAVRVLADAKKTGRPKRRKNRPHEDTDSRGLTAKIPDSPNRTMEMSAGTAGGTYERTDLIHPEVPAFYVEKEILVVHTEATVSDGPPV